jgi:hypothetical protein
MNLARSSHLNHSCKNHLVMGLFHHVQPHRPRVAVGEKLCGILLAKAANCAGFAGFADS